MIGAVILGGLILLHTNWWVALLIGIPLWLISLFMRGS